MKQTTLAVLFSLAFAACVRAETSSTPSYDVSGSYFEGCACPAGSCPCDFGKNATSTMGCQATMLFHVTKGRYGDVSLDGLNVAAVLLEPVHNISEAAGKLEGGLYVDERASAAQRDALAGLVKATVGTLFGTVSGPKAVPITFSEKGVDAAGLADEYAAEIPSVLSLRVTPFKNQAGERSARINVPGFFAEKQYMGKADVHTYTDKEWSAHWDLSGGNAFYSPFHFSSTSTM